MAEADPNGRARPASPMGSAAQPGPQALAQAAEWFAVLSGSPSAQERQDWQHWLQAQPQHGQAWRRVEALQQQFDALPSGLDRRAAAQALARPAEAGLRRRALLGLGTLGLAGSSAWLLQQHQPWQGWLADASTAVGEQRQLDLPDGTRLWLNTHTALQLPSAPDPHTLRLLRGELLVHTAAAMPSPTATRSATEPAPAWRLQLPMGELRPLGSAPGQGHGTRFCARLQDAQCLLTVFDGAVEAHHPAQARPQRVAAGQQLRFGDGPLALPQAAAPEADAWVRGMLVVAGWSLAEFCAELGRYQSGWLSCADSVAGLRLVGAFPLRDLDQVYRSLERSLPVRVQRSVPGWVRIVPV